MRARNLFILASIFFGVNVAHALCPQPTPKICSAYFESDTVFTGKILSQKYVSQEDDNDWIEYKVQVIKRYRGKVGPIARVRTKNASARWIGDEGKKYVFFLNRGETYSTCGPLDEPDYVHDVVRQIDLLKHATSSTIEGQVFSRSGPWGGGNGIPVVAAQMTAKATSGSKEYVTVTDNEGRFSISLPPGKYRLKAPGMNLSDYSQGEVQEINLEKGQCAQLELLK